MTLTIMPMTFEELLASNAALSGEVQRSQEALKIALLTIDKLKVEVAYLRRMKYGRSSEQLEHAQLELVGGQVAQPSGAPTLNAETDGQDKSNVTSIEQGRKKRLAKQHLRGLRQRPARNRPGRFGSAGLRARQLSRRAPRSPEAGLCRLQHDRASASGQPPN